MVKHNNVLVNAHFHKDWQNRVKTWFNQPAKAAARKLHRKQVASLIAPRPAAGLLRPIVRCPTQKYNMKTRLGRGFTFAELRAAKINPKEARSIGIAVDHKRDNKSVEGFQANVDRLNAYKSKLILFPKKYCTPKNGEATAEECKAAKQVIGEILPIEKSASKVEVVEIPKVRAYMGLKQARADARHVGHRAARAAALAEKANETN
ncbi:hypothetical protein WA158_004327 [Blastocystis sp. Blastoise]